MPSTRTKGWSVDRRTLPEGLVDCHASFDGPCHRPRSMGPGALGPHDPQSPPVHTLMQPLTTVGFVAIRATVREKTMEREKEEQMHAKNAWWMIIVGGMVGALLAAGAAVQAEDFPGDGVTGPPLSYRLQSNGTVRDNNTLLIWEVKDTSGGIHDVNRP